MEFQPNQMVRVATDDGQHLAGAVGTFVRYRREVERQRLRPDADCLVMITTPGKGTRMWLLQAENLQPFDPERDLR